MIARPTYSLRIDSWLLAITGLGFILRLIFIFKGAQIYYGAGLENYNGDSLSFINSFMNLWQTGDYTFEPLIPDASFGRLPGYPFFYGIHYIIFGPKFVIEALVFSQLLLDTAIIIILYNTMFRWTALAWSARIVALLYAVYPFAIIWITIIGSETLNNFCTVAWVSLLTKSSEKKRYYVLIGVLAVLAFYVREYMGILLPISVVFVWLWSRQTLAVQWQRVLLVGLGFGMLYIWWPVRNYVNYNRIELVKPATAGYANLREDMQAYLGWLHSWSNDNTTWVNKILFNEPLHYPSELFSSPVEERRAYALSALAARCGGSFQLSRLNTHDYRLSLPPVFRSCNPEIAAGFDSLRLSYKQHHPVKYYLDVPLANLYKAVFKSSTVVKSSSSVKTIVQRVLFSYRTVMVIVGSVGLWIGRKHAYLWPVAAYSVFIYVFISFYFRSLEMRYLLQADVLLLLPAAWVIGCWVNKWFHFGSFKSH